MFSRLLSARLWPVVALCLLACGAPSSDDSADDEAVELSGDGAPIGRFKPMRKRPRTLSPEESARAEELAALGYVSGSQPARSEEVITLYDPERAQPGNNLYVAGHSPTAYLMDMDGKVLHEWHYRYQDIWDDYIPDLKGAGMDSWRRVHLFENGDILAIFEYFGIIKLDKDSNLLWANRNNAHHDLEVLPDGSIYTLITEKHIDPRVHESEQIWEDHLVQLDADGRELRRCSMVDAFESAGINWKELPRALPKGDIMHTNTVAVIGEDVREDLPWLKPGLILTSSRTLSTVSFVDMDLCRVAKLLSGAWFRQHDPQLLPSGRLMIFDNRGLRRYSRVIEVNPKTGRLKWEYRGTAEEPFYTEWCGAASRLPNGNTLINETDAGRAFEVTPEGEIVWEFYNPHRVGEEPELIASLYEVLRIPLDFPMDWLATTP